MVMGGLVLMSLVLKRPNVQKAEAVRSTATGPASTLLEHAESWVTCRLHKNGQRPTCATPEIGLMHLSGCARRAAERYRTFRVASQCTPFPDPAYRSAQALRRQLKKRAAQRRAVSGLCAFFHSPAANLLASEKVG